MGLALKAGQDWDEPTVEILYRTVLTPRPAKAPAKGLEILVKNSKSYIQSKRKNCKLKDSLSDLNCQKTPVPGSC